MPSFKEGDRVRVVTRDVTEEDRKKSVYFDHMAGLTGTVQNVYGPTEVAVKIDTEALGRITKEVHKTATERMREKSITEELKKQLTPEEVNFDSHYILLVQGADLEKIK